MTALTPGGNESPSRVNGRRLAMVALIVFVVLVGEIATGWLRMSYRFLIAEETFVTLTVSGLVCGTQSDFETQGLSIKAGSRITFHNHTGYWTVPVQIATGDTSAKSRIVESPLIPPGANWSHVFWRPGQYEITVLGGGTSVDGLSGTIFVIR